MGGGGAIARGVVERGVEVAPEVLQRALRRPWDLLAPGVKYFKKIPNVLEDKRF